MNWQMVQLVFVLVQHTISIIGVTIIVLGVAVGLFQFVFYLFTAQLIDKNSKINKIRLNLSRTLILGLEFIVAADLIGSTTAPDYYTVGLLAIIVAVRTVLTFSINREITSLTRE